MEIFWDMFQFSAGNIFMSVIALLISLTLVIFVHEMGHYLTARFFQVNIKQFSIGFGKEVLGYTDRHGTRWSISRIPLGGYVKIFGDLNPANPQIWDEKHQKARPLTKAEQEVAFFKKPVWKRMLIVAAGPFINFLLGFLILFFLFSVRGQVSSLPVVTAINTDSSGYESGFQLEDEILAVDGEPVSRMEDIWRITLHEPGVPIEFKIMRDNQVLTITAASQEIEYTDPNGVKRSHGQLGITRFIGFPLEEIIAVNGADVTDNVDKARQLMIDHLGEDITITVNYGTETDDFIVHVYEKTNQHLFDPKDERYDFVYFSKTKDPFYYHLGFFEAGKTAFLLTGKLLEEALKITWAILTGATGKQTVGGIASIGQTAGETIQYGWYSFLVFVAVLSVQIGFLNLFPIPVLDGGYLVFLTYEAIRGKPLSEKTQNYALILGLAFLFGIMIIANVNDLFQLSLQ